MASGLKVLGLCSSKAAHCQWDDQFEAKEAGREPGLRYSTGSPVQTPLGNVIESADWQLEAHVALSSPLSCPPVSRDARVMVCTNSVMSSAKPHEERLEYSQHRRLGYKFYTHMVAHNQDYQGTVSCLPR